MPFFAMLPCEAAATKRGRGRGERERETNKRSIGVAEPAVTRRGGEMDGQEQKQRLLYGHTEAADPASETTRR